MLRDYRQYLAEARQRTVILLFRRKIVHFMQMFVLIRKQNKVDYILDDEQKS